MSLLWKVPLIVVLVVLTLGLLYSALLFPAMGLVILFLIVLVLALAWACAGSSLSDVLTQSW